MTIMTTYFSFLSVNICYYRYVTAGPKGAVKREKLCCSSICHKGPIFSLIEQLFLHFTSFRLVSTKASSGVLENVTLFIK